MMFLGFTFSFAIIKKKNYVSKVSTSNQTKIVFLLLNKNTGHENLKSHFKNIFTANLFTELIKLRF